MNLSLRVRCGSTLSNLKGFALCRRPPILDSPAFWIATFLAPKPDICELWEAHFGILDRHLGGLGVLGDTQQHTLGSRWCFLSIFYHFWVPPGTHLELILLTLSCFWATYLDTGVQSDVLVISEWNSCQDPMLECA